VERKPPVPVEGGERVYVQQRYWIGTLGPLLVLVALLAVSIIRLSTGSPLRLDNYVVVVIPVVLLVNIIGMRQPRRIVDTQAALVLEGMRQRQVFPWNEMTSLKVREFAFTDRMYLRIEPSGLLSGACWIDQGKYPRFAELREKLLAKERELHPERAKFQKTAKRAPRKRTR